ncbi:class I SAM-dependent methyltransferase [Nonlabens sp. SY33080]|uniref:class I SAM-dependent methyltransferase n=1 Tax=Nonlabens sp. SY33080 TaxID=2719911 RepID=UPI001428A88B|nr:class I SAM-dependent methyltransferase [Nonlabens sp. SY33080]
MYFFNYLPDENSKLILDFLIEYNLDISNKYLFDSKLMKDIPSNDFFSNLSFESIHFKDSLENNGLINFCTFSLSKFNFEENKVVSIRRNSVDLFLDAFLLRNCGCVNVDEEIYSLNAANIQNDIKSNHLDVAKTVYSLNDYDKINTNHLVLDYNNLIGLRSKSKQIEEFRKVLNFLNMESSDDDLITKLSNALNKTSFQKNSYTKIDYGYIHFKGLKLILKKSNLYTLNKKNGYKKSFIQSIKKYFSSQNLSFYDTYWKTNSSKGGKWVYGINIINHLIDNYSFKSILDAGCGSADVTRYLLEKGYDAKGIELSGEVLKENARDLLKLNKVQQGSLSQLPFDDNSFDVVFSSEVLEHIPEKDIKKTISELIRVSRNYLFLTISLRPSSNFNKYHVTLKPRKWWEEMFLSMGCEKDHTLVNKLQKKGNDLSLKEVLMEGPTKSHIKEMEWFIEQNSYSLNSEIEPWFFIFKKNE